MLEVLTKLARSLGGLSLSAGTLISLAYFLRIRYLPVESMSALAALGTAVITRSGAFFVSLIVLWGMPAALLVSVRDSPSRDVFLGRFDAPAPGKDGQPMPSLRRCLLFTISTLGAVWLAILGDAVLSSQASTQGWKPLWNSLLAALAIGGAWWYAVGRWLPFGKAGRPVDGGWRAAAKRFVGAATYAICSALPLLLFIEMVVASKFRTVSDPLAIAATLGSGATVSVLFNTVMVDASANRRISQADMLKAGLLFSCGILIIGLGWLQLAARVQDNLMATASVRINRAHIVLSKDACATLGQIGVATATLHDGDGRATEGCMLPDVTVQSRLGDRWRVSCDPEEQATDLPDVDPFAKARRRHVESAFMLDAKSILTWYELDAASVGPRYGLRTVCGDWGKAS